MRMRARSRRARTQRRKSKIEVHKSTDGDKDYIKIHLFCCRIIAYIYDDVVESITACLHVSVVELANGQIDRRPFATHRKIQQPRQ